MLRDTLRARVFALANIGGGKLPFVADQARRVIRSVAAHTSKEDRGDTIRPSPQEMPQRTR